MQSTAGWRGSPKRAKRALGVHGCGRKFKSCHSDQIRPIRISGWSYFFSLIWSCSHPCVCFAYVKSWTLAGSLFRRYAANPKNSTSLVLWNPSRSLHSDQKRAIERLLVFSLFYKAFRAFLGVFQERYFSCPATQVGGRVLRKVLRKINNIAFWANL